MKTKILSIEKAKIKEAVIFSALLLTATFVPLLGSQAVTGPIVNAALFLATLVVGVQGALMVALFPSLVALFSGAILPPAALPMVPFIMVANCILVLLFSRFSERFWAGVVIASFAKFLFLALTSLLFFGILFEGLVPEQILVIMSWPQLVTALLGGVIAFGVKGFFKK